MAYDTAHFENPTTGERAEAPVGNSWTVFFFGVFVPLLRGDLKWFGITTAFAVGGAIILNIFMPLFAIPGWVFFALKYNDLYIKDLVRSGYKLRYRESENRSAEGLSNKVGIRVECLNENV